MSFDDDLARIALQEQELQFETFAPETAWQLGSLIHRLATDRQLGVVIDISLYSMPLFFAALSGSSPDNIQWVRRKRNLTLRLYRSSYATALELSREGKTLQAAFGLPEADFTPHGGSFPIFLKGTGCIGAVTVSGLPQRADHDLVVEGLASFIGRDIADLKLDSL